MSEFSLLPNSTMDRRHFICQAGKAAALLGVAGSPLTVFAKPSPESQKLEVHLFSKHLQFLNYKDAGEAAASLGFDGLDLTVRPKGHILPSEVREQLPLAMEAIRKGGSRCNLITTAVESVDNPLDIDVLETAAAEGIGMYRTNWYRYNDTLAMKESLKVYRGQVSALSRVNARLGLVGCYQNHAGKMVGASAWELDNLLAETDTAHFGIQYDIRHATVEGGLSWENGLRLLRSRIKAIVIKDFRWEKIQGQWKVVNTPIGEGMVDFPRFFSLLKEYGIKVPAILHLEYPLGGAEHGERSLHIDKSHVFSAMSKDLKLLQELWEQA